MSDPLSINRLYGRRQGRALRAGQRALLDTLFPQVAVPQDGPLDAQHLFGDARPLHLEIGFGGGEHLAAQAAAAEGAGFIGCEPFLNGVVGALAHIRDKKLDNVRLFMGNALTLMARLPDASLDMVYLLHPDPWPKSRHAKRRMVNPGPLDLIAAKLKRGGELRLGTDHPVYCRWALMQMAQRQDFAWLVRRPQDWQVRRADWPETRYEAKARRAGREVWYLRYRRR